MERTQGSGKQNFNNVAFENIQCNTLCFDVRVSTRESIYSHTPFCVHTFKSIHKHTHTNTHKHTHTNTHKT